MLNVLDKEGKATGLAYNTDERRFRGHHAELGQTCVWLSKQLEKGEVPNQAEVQAQQFKANRQAQLDNSIVTTQSGKQFDADEASIIRLGNALVAANGEPEDTIIKWSLANDGTGVMTNCTKAEVREAHRLAMENMSAIWSV